MNRCRLAVLALASSVATSCGFQHSSSVLAPTSTTGGAGGTGTSTSTSTPSLVGTWASSPLPTLPSPSSCGNFKYQITTQTASSIAGTFTGVCGGGLTIAGNATGQLNGTAVTLVLTGTAAMPGIASCTFSLNATGSVEDSGNTLRLPFSGTTCLGPVSGTEVLRRPQPAADPTPVPAPTPTPSPGPAPAPVPTSLDAIDLRQVTVINPAVDVANWPITTRISVLDFNSGGVAVEFSKKDGPGRWPDIVPPGWDGPIQYTIWMVENIGGRWYTSGGVEYWYRLGRQGGPPSQFANNWYYSPQVWGPLASHQPAVGEQVGFFVTAGDQRAKDVRFVTERSNVVVVSFPSDSGGYYPF